MRLSTFSALRRDLEHQWCTQQKISHLSPGANEILSHNYRSQKSCRIFCQIAEFYSGMGGQTLPRPGNTEYLLGARQIGTSPPTPTSKTYRNSRQPGWLVQLPCPENRNTMVPWQLVPRPLVLVTIQPACFGPWTLSLENVYSLWQMHPKWTNCFPPQNCSLGPRKSGTNCSSVSLGPTLIMTSPTLWHIVLRKTKNLNFSSQTNTLLSHTVKNK
jgi:hypothetical protein